MARAMGETRRAQTAALDVGVTSEVDIVPGRQCLRTEQHARQHQHDARGSAQVSQTEEGVNELHAGQAGGPSGVLLYNAATSPHKALPLNARGSRC